ncbi:hypothetical protein T08_12334 [Trichinella sp. T8]|nr:hypothetical protein T08_12334 [Trichinella sp. T8]
MLKTNDDEIQFVSTQKKNQQRLIYRVQKSIGCYATISTSWELIQIIRSGEHVESCTKPDKLKQWVFVRSKREARSRIRYTLAQPEFNAEQTMTKSSQQHLIYHPPTNSILNFATKTLEDRLAWNVKKRITFTIRGINENVEMLMALAFLVVQLVSAGFEILNVGASGQIETLFEYLQQEWLMNVKTS